MSKQKAKAQDPQLQLRALYTALARAWAECKTFSEIASDLYRLGVIDKPERPYPGYEGGKRDYVLERLDQANDVELFLREGVPELVFELGYERGVGTGIIERVLKSMGYNEEPEAEMHDIIYYVPPADLSPFSNRQSNQQVVSVTIEGLPTQLAKLIDELNDNIERENPNAAAFLIRKIIADACCLALVKIGKPELITDADGNDLDLNQLIAVCGQELRISSRILSRVQAAKWMGDSANHSYRLKIYPNDIVKPSMALRIFLGEIFSS